jgi:O-antigen/teichoic acid export membrane protein
MLIARAARNDTQGLARGLTDGTRRALLLGLLPVAILVVAAQPLIQFWVGPQYLSRSVPVMWIMLANVLMSLPAMCAYYTLLAVSHLKWFSVASALAGVTNVLLSIIMAKYLKMGLIGVASGTLVSMILWCTIYMCTLACKHCSLPFSRYLVLVWLKPLIAGSIILLMGFSLAHIWKPSSLLETLILLCVLGVLFVPVIYAVGLTAEERLLFAQKVGEMLSSIRRRFRKKFDSER